jgi:hypothetical protein
MSMAIICFLIFTVYWAAQKKAQELNNTENIHELAIEIRLYESENSKYPATLDELISSSDTESKEKLIRILHDKMGHTYKYEPQTNGFKIDVSSPNRWYEKGDVYLVKFEDFGNRSIQTINGAVDEQEGISRTIVTNNL